MNPQVNTEPKNEIGQSMFLGETTVGSSTKPSTSLPALSSTGFQPASTSLSSFKAVAAQPPPSQNPPVNLVTVLTKNGQVLFKPPVTGMKSNRPSSLVTMNNNNGASTMIPKGHIIVRQKPLASNSSQSQSSSSSQQSTTTLDMAALEKAGLKRPLTTPGGNMITKVIITKNPVSGQMQPFPASGSGISHHQTNSNNLSSSSLANTATIIASNALGTSVINKQQLINSTAAFQAASPTKTVTITSQGILSPVKTVIATVPGTSSKVSLPIQKIPISPAKQPTKITMIPSTKSPLKQTVNPNITVLSRALNSLSQTGTVAINPSNSPSKVIIKQGPAPTTAITLKAQGLPTLAPQTGKSLQMVQSVRTPQIAQNVRPIAVSNAGGASIQTIPVSGNRFHYVRLVAPGSNQTQTTSIAIPKSTVVGGHHPVHSSSTSKPVTIVAMSNASSSLANSNQVKVTLPIPQHTTLAPKPIAISAANTNNVPSYSVILPSPSTTSTHNTNNSASISSQSSNSVVTTLAPIQPAPPANSLRQIPLGTTILTAGGNNANMQNLQNLQGFALVPASYVTQLQHQMKPVQAPPQPQPTAVSQALAAAKQSSRDYIPIASIDPAITQYTVSRNIPSQNGPTLEATGARPRKPCNCTKSQCLKLYCDCFANGEFCQNCNCTNCANNLEHEEERSKAIKSCLDRNPQAFHPKIGKGKDVEGNRRHNKGCNCKRSGCLKNYCECYEAKIMCSNFCKCIGCKNFEESPERKTLMHLADAAEVRVQQQTAAKTKLSSQISSVPTRPPTSSANGERLPFSFITADVAEATSACLLAQAEEAERMRMPPVVQERMIIEEFGRCLMQIIESANRTRAASTLA